MKHLHAVPLVEKTREMPFLRVEGEGVEAIL